MIKGKDKALITGTTGVGGRPGPRPDPVEQLDCV
jgi:hypothetical protein